MHSFAGSPRLLGWDCLPSLVIYRSATDTIHLRNLFLLIFSSCFFTAKLYLSITFFFNQLNTLSIYSRVWYSMNIPSYPKSYPPTRIFLLLLAMFNPRYMHSAHTSCTVHSLYSAHLMHSSTVYTSITSHLSSINKTPLSATWN